jgi:hypothetical protein
MRLLDRGAESTEFELLASNKYGAAKHSYGLDNLNDLMVLYAQNYFPVECGRNPKLLVSIIMKMTLIPYVENQLQEAKAKPVNNEHSNLARMLHQLIAEKKAISLLDYPVSNTFTRPPIQKLFGELLSYYKNTYMTKHANFFNDCLLVMLRDFEICPFVASLKDCYIIFHLVNNHKDTGFKTEHLCQLLQVLCDSYLPLASDASQNDHNLVAMSVEGDSRAVLMLKKIELSKGYEAYRKERLMAGVAKPPVVLAKNTSIAPPESPNHRTDPGVFSRNTSSFKTVSSAGYRTLSILQTSTKTGICCFNDTESHLIELTERHERILNGVFEHFSHIDDATKKRVMKACYLVEIF